jgi:ATP-dependent Clp protease ATP-binding subunit ClpX
MSLDAQDTCSFCGKNKESVQKLIVSDRVAICNECVDLCQELLTDQHETATGADRAPGAPHDPRAIRDYLDQYVIGQTDAKTALAVAVVNHYKRVNRRLNQPEISKANILMLGPTGSGKTLLARTVARYLDVPFVIADATSLTEAGYVGDDVEMLISRLYTAAGSDVERCQRGIVFVDEIDKIARKGESTSITRDVSGEGVQQALLKLVEGTRCRVMTQGQRRHPQGDSVEIDTTDILFIAGGAFVGLEDIIKRRCRGTAMGFHSNIQSLDQYWAGDVTPDDLVSFGMIPEFVGRFPISVSLTSLDRSDMLAILTQVRNNYLEQYQWLFQQDDVSLEFDAEALEALVDRAMQRRTGARALHSEIERVLQPHMFELRGYRERGIQSVRIDVPQVNNPTIL